MKKTKGKDNSTITQEGQVVAVPASPATFYESKFDSLEMPWLTGAVAGVSLATAVSYHLGYFFAVDIKLMSFFSLEDVLRSTLYFTPLIVVAWLIRSFSLKTIRPNLSGEKHQAHTFFREPLKQLPIAALIVVVIYFFTTLWARNLLIYSTVVFIIVQDVLFKIKDDEKRFYYLDVSYLGVLIVSTFLIGAQVGQSDLEPSPLRYEISLVSGAVIRVNLMNSGSQYLLIRDADNATRLLASSEVRSIQALDIQAPKARYSIGKIVDWIRSFEFFSQ